jgi:hypothetical protein
VELKIENKHELVLKKSIGPVSIGESRDEIHSRLGEPDYVQDYDGSRVREIYDSLDLSIDYQGSPAVCIAVETSSDSSLILNGLDLFRMSWPSFLNWIRQHDPDVRERKTSTVISQALGFSTCPKSGEPNRTESIFVFGEDFYWPTDEEMKAEARREIANMPSASEMAKELGLEDYFSDL